MSNTITTSGTFHLITISAAVPGMLVTTKEFTIECVNFSTIHVTGNVIATITSPKCGESSKTLGLSFTATSTTQNHLTYTGIKYDLQARTGAGEEKTAALVSNTTHTQPSQGN